MVLLLCHPRKVFEFHCSEKHRGCPAAVQFCPDHPHLTPVSQQWKVNPTMTVWAQFMKTHQFYSTFLHPSPVQADGGIQSSHCQLQLCHLHLVIEWPRAGGTVSTLGHRDTSDLHKSSSEKLRGNSSAVSWAQLWAVRCELKDSSWSRRELSLQSWLSKAAVVLKWWGIHIIPHTWHLWSPAGHRELRLLPGYTIHPHKYLMPKSNLHLIVPVTHQSPYKNKV